MSFLNVVSEMFSCLFDYNKKKNTKNKVKKKKQGKLLLNFSNPNHQQE